MKNFLIGLLALGSISAFAQLENWYKEGANSVVSVIAQKPERAELKFALKGKQGKFEENVVEELRNDLSFNKFSQTVSSAQLPLNKMITPQKPTLISVSSDRQIVKWKSEVISSVSGKKIFSVGITCRYINDSRTGIYRDAATIFDCLVNGIN